jgi:hypothetical protein
MNGHIFASIGHKLIPVVRLVPPLRDPLRLESGGRASQRAGEARQRAAALGTDRADLSDDM